MKFYSQHQEDFYIDHISRYRNLKLSKTVIELGAHDGIELSNSRFFYEFCEYEALLVECNTDTIPQLQKNIEKFKRVKLITNPITADGGLTKFKRNESPTHSGIAETGDPMESITYQQLLERVGWTDKPIGILSIDIEGQDTNVLENVLKTKHLPEWIIIESNHKTDRKKQIELLLNDYYLIHIFDVNTIWLRNDLAYWL